MKPVGTAFTALARAASVAALLVLLGAGVSSAAETPPQVQPAAPVLLAYGDDDIWDENGQIIKKGHGGANMTQADEVP